MKIIPLSASLLPSQQYAEIEVKLLLIGQLLGHFRCYKENKANLKEGRARLPVISWLCWSSVLYLLQSVVNTMLLSEGKTAGAPLT